MIRLEKVNKFFGDLHVLKDVSLEVAEGEKLVINNGEIGPVAQKLYDNLTGIQYGELKDDFGWVMKLD